MEPDHMDIRLVYIAISIWAFAMAIIIVKEFVNKGKGNE
jgi:hypothetical protein